MSSREENNVNGNGEYEAYGVDDVTELSAEEIEKLLAESTGGYAGGEPEDTAAGDVLEMLEEAGDHKDDDLRDIQDMLRRSDRNEAIEADEPEAGHQENPVDKLLEDIDGASVDSGEPMDAKTRKAREKQRKNGEKSRKAQEKAEKAAKKKADKEAARAEKAARRGLRKRSGAENPEPEETGNEEPEEIREYDLLQDKELLDSIVSKAEDAGHEKKETSQNFSVNNLGPEYDAARERETAHKTERIMDKDVGAQMEEELSKEESAQSGIMEVDMDEIDAFIPDVSEGQKEQPGKQKGGLMNKIIKLLTEEEEPENEDLMISDENMEIIKDLDKEKKSGGKKDKKAKKPAKKKEQKKKAPKPAKPKKPKKVKEKEPYVPGRKITFRKALPILLLGATIGAVLFIFVNLVTDFTVKKEAEEAYRNGDYAVCYQNLYGRKLNEEQAQMYGKSESILYMEQEYRKFDIVLKKGSEAEALDSLLQTVHSFPEVQAYAAKCQALTEVEEIYGRIIGILSDRYGLAEDEAKEIAAIASSIEYTRAVTAVAEGRGYGSHGVPDDTQAPAEGIGGNPEGQPGTQGQLEDGTEPIPDELPEEGELGEGNFVDD